MLVISQAKRLKACTTQLNQPLVQLLCNKVKSEQKSKSISNTQVYTQVLDNLTPIHVHLSANVISHDHLLQSLLGSPSLNV